MPSTSTVTQTVTSTKLAVATLVLLAAGGAAFMLTPTPKTQTATDLYRTKFVGQATLVKQTNPTQAIKLPNQAIPQTSPVCAIVNGIAFDQNGNQSWQKMNAAGAPLFAASSGSDPLRIAKDARSFSLSIKGKDGSGCQPIVMNYIPFITSSTFPLGAWTVTRVDNNLAQVLGSGNVGAKNNGFSLQNLKLQVNPGQIVELTVNIDTTGANTSTDAYAVAVGTPVRWMVIGGNAYTTNDYLPTPWITFSHNPNMIQ